jgi:hypothetical protein
MGDVRDDPPLDQGYSNANTSEAKALLESAMERTMQRLAISACYWCRSDGAMDGIRDSCRRGWELETAMHAYITPTNVSWANTGDTVDHVPSG